MDSDDDTGHGQCETGKDDDDAQRPEREQMASQGLMGLVQQALCLCLKAVIIDPVRR
jgi:hypothetical protein